MIERYSEKYREDIIEIVNNFYNEVIHLYNVGLDREKLIQIIDGFREKSKGQVFLLVVDGKCQGLLAGIEPPIPFGTRRIFQEVIWYINRDYRRHGVRLLIEAQRLLKNEGFDLMIMSVLEESKSEKIKALYERMGYKKLETHFIKDLNGK